MRVKGDGSASALCGFLDTLEPERKNRKVQSSSVLLSAAKPSHPPPPPSPPPIHPETAHTDPDWLHLRENSHLLLVLPRRQKLGVILYPIYVQSWTR